MQSFLMNTTMNAPTARWILQKNPSKESVIEGSEKIAYHLHPRWRCQPWPQYSTKTSTPEAGATPTSTSSGERSWIRSWSVRSPILMTIRQSTPFCFTHATSFLFSFKSNHFSFNPFNPTRILKNPSCKILGQSATYQPPINQTTT